MKTEYKFIHFKVIRELPKTKVWGIFNNRTKVQLGGVAWYPPWRQYCFYGADTNSVFNVGCLNDIIDFMKQLGNGGGNCNDM